MTLSLAALVMVIFCIAVAIWIAHLDRGPGQTPDPVIFLCGLAAMNLGFLARGLRLIFDGRRRDRYEDGVLAVNRTRLTWVGQLLVGVFWAAGGGVMIGRMAANLGLRGPHLAYLTAAAAVVLTAFLVVLQARRQAALGPVLTVSAAGIFMRQLMHRPVRWDEIDALAPTARWRRGRIGFNSHDVVRRVGSRVAFPFLGARSYELRNYGLDATQADILLAIERFQPRLTQALASPEPEAVEWVGG